MGLTMRDSQVRARYPWAGGTPARLHLWEIRTLDGACHRLVRETAGQGHSDGHIARHPKRLTSPQVDLLGRYSNSLPWSEEVYRISELSESRKGDVKLPLSPESPLRRLNAEQA
ncbi:hypothetical protein Kisp01_69880 [Kineosporia sp. NBRC 101677]|nr:hypothetical protein Kisp01_69880 [Kineosporia sp. NBRC 101677]